MMLMAAEVDILKRLRAAERVDTIAWYDDHAWKMLICVARQLANRPAQHNHR